MAAGSYSCATDTNAGLWCWGSVGIGSGYATAALTVDSMIHIAAGGVLPNMAQIWWGDGSGNKLNFGTQIGGTFTPLVTFLDSGSVGIGTTNPRQVLEVNGAIKVTGNVAATNTIGKDNIVKAWCNFNGAASGVCTQGFNVASVTRTGVGNYTINWTTPFANANYAISGTCLGGGSITNFALSTVPLTTTGANVVCLTWNGIYTDSSIVTLIAIGQQP